MQKTPILITGCQRSGTTLLGLILDSHPDMISIDEDKFDYRSINTYLYAQWFPQYVSFKLPRYAQILSFLKSFDDLKLIWCIRDPIDVVSSMLKLQISLDKTNTVAWAAHPNCAEAEILNSYWVLHDSAKRDLTDDMNKYRVIVKKNPLLRSRLDCIFLGAFCWSIKNELLALYKLENIDFHIVKYESLVNENETEKTIKEILDYIGVGWSPDVLKHHKMHGGQSIGKTSNSRAIDNSGVGGGVSNFTDDEIELIKNICSK